MPRVHVSIGSNQDREHNVRRAVAALARRFGPLDLSPVYEAEAVGFRGDAFLNLAAGFDTDDDLDTVIDALHAIEADCGRVRTEKRFGPRTMDIDVLTYGDLICEDDPVELPRSEITREAYVLLPLVDIAPEVRHPALGESFRALLERLKPDTSKLHRIDFPLDVSPRSDA